MTDKEREVELYQRLTSLLPAFTQFPEGFDDERMIRLIALMHEYRTLTLLRRSTEE